MDRKEQFKFDLYKKRITKIPFLEYFKKDEYLKNRLLEQYLNTELRINKDLFYDKKCRLKKLKENYDNEVFYWRDILNEHILNEDLPNTFYTPTIEHTPIFKGLDHAYKIIDDFKNRVLLPRNYDAVKYAETFAYNFINILKNLEIEGLTLRVLNAFLNDKENMAIRSDLIVVKMFGSETDFIKKFGISYETAWEYYRELKGYADKKIKEFLLDIKEDNNTIEPDFSNWVIPNSHPWKEISYKYTTRKEYQNPQDLKAVFNNSYAHYPLKLKEYFEKYRVLPLDYLNNLIFEFRQEFPQTGRIQNINYFDDLIIQLIDFYQHKNTNDQTVQTQEICKLKEVQSPLFEDLTKDQQKHKIAFDLVGENNTNTNNPVYHHIERVLQKYQLTNKQGKDILLTMRGGFSFNINEVTIPKIIDYLNEVDFTPKTLIYPPQQIQHILESKEIIITSQLEKCLKIIGYYTHEDKTVIDKVLDKNINAFELFVEPFKKELNTNLIIKNTIEAKKDLIRYYVFEFFEIQGFYNVYNKILFTGSLSSITPIKYEHRDEKGTLKKLDKFENYVINSWQLFDMLFTEIQLCCVKYRIDFFKLCHELNFPLEHIDSGVTVAFETMQRKALPPTQNTMQKPELNETLILFNSPETITKLHNELKGYFPGFEKELQQALNGERLNQLILFPHNQNKFVEVFKRAKYNSLILSNATEIKKWICSNFLRLTKGNQKEFNQSTVWDILTKDKGEPTKNQRICVVDWLPFKTYNDRQY